MVAFKNNPGVLRDLELDLYDDASVRDVAGRWSTGLGPGQWPPAKVGADPETAASFILHLLRTDTSLRTAFPRALSEGPEGAFCRWLCSPEALTRYDLPATAQTTIRKAFQARPSARIRQVYEQRLISNGLISCPTCPPGGPASFAGWSPRGGSNMNSQTPRSGGSCSNAPRIRNAS